MKKLTIFLLTCGFCVSANADIWKWVDAKGDTHFVDSNTPIYTWLDELGKVHYSDKPDHENAVSVQLVWHAPGKLDDSGDGATARVKADTSRPGETAEEKFEREAAEAYYCKRAREIYETYSKAPRLYTTASDGQRVYLSDEESAQTLADTKAKVDELCG